MAEISSNLPSLNPSLSTSAKRSFREEKKVGVPTLFEPKTSLDFFQKTLDKLDDYTFNTHTKTYFKLQLNELDQQCTSIKKRY